MYGLPERFVFGAVSFECSDAKLAKNLPITSFVMESLADVNTAPSVAHVTMEFIPGVDPTDNHETIQWQWNGVRAHLQAGRVRGLLTACASGQYAARFEVPRLDADCLNAAVASASSAVVTHEGGLLVHAAAVDMDGKAVLFIGPSGAGKTTACSHMKGCTWLALDRVALVYVRDQWLAWRLPWGNKDGLQLRCSKATFLPLAGILRVRQSDTLDIQTCSRWQAATILRESLRIGTANVREEEKMLECAERLNQRCPLGIIQVPLGVNLTYAVQAWLDKVRA